jgi:hypothetical protein
LAAAAGPDDADAGADAALHAADGDDTPAAPTEDAR